MKRPLMFMILWKANSLNQKVIWQDEGIPLQFSWMVKFMRMAVPNLKVLTVMTLMLFYQVQKGVILISMGMIGLQKAL